MHPRAPVLALSSLVLALATASSSSVAGPPPGFTVTTVASGFWIPTAFAYAPDGRIFVTEKGGRVKLVSGGVAKTFIDLSAETNEFHDRGMLGIALDPAFEQNGFVYLFLVAELNSPPDSDLPAEGKVIRLTASAGDPDLADPSSQITLLSGFDNHSFTHSGGCLRFDADGRLLASFGDGSSPLYVDPRALETYDLDTLTGKIVRIDPATGEGVADNPYFDPGDPASTRSKVLARGLRNPFRFGIDPDSGDLYVAEVGWTAWEEINRVPLFWSDPEIDLNFGWPCYEGGKGVSLVQPDYAADPMTGVACQAIYPPSAGGSGAGSAPALHAYNHADPGGEGGSAVIAGVFYVGGGSYPPEYLERFFFGDFARDRIQTLTRDGQVADFGTPGDWGSPVDIQLSPSGNVAYLGISDHQLHEIVFVGGAAPPTAAATARNGGTRQWVRFSAEGSSDPNGDRLQYTWNFGDGRVRRGRKLRHRYREPGPFTATLVVTEDTPAALSGSASVVVHPENRPPTVKIRSPRDRSRYSAGDTMTLTIEANDEEDGTFADASVSWEVLLHHLGHVHYVLSRDGTTGSFTVPPHDEDSYLSVTAKARDSLGEETTASITLVPR